MRASILVYAAAGYNVALALFHLGFWRLLSWREELPKLIPANRGVLQVMNLMLAYVFVAVALLFLVFGGAVAAEPVGRAVLAGMAGFWLVRAFLQPRFWPEIPRTVNAAFVGLFLLGAVLHAAVLFR